jgi:hypothetical protein
MKTLIWNQETWNYEIRLNGILIAISNQNEIGLLTDRIRAYECRMNNITIIIN